MNSVQLRNIAALAADHLRGVALPAQNPNAMLQLWDGIRAAEAAAVSLASTEERTAAALAAPSAGGLTQAQ